MAALSRTSPASAEVGLIAELVAQNDRDGLRLDRDQTRILLKRLDLIKRQIATLEHEVGIYRAREDGEAAAAVLDDLCMEVLCDAILDDARSEDRVVYPDFKGGRHNG